MERSRRRRSSVAGRSSYVEMLSCDACVVDSPQYRANLKRCETEAVKIETSLSKVVKACSDMVDQSQKYGSSVNVFLDTLHCFGTVGDDSSPLAQVTSEVPIKLKSSIKKFSSLMKDLESHRELLMSQAKMTISDALEDYIQNELKPVKEVGKVFQKLSDDVDKCRTTYAGTPKNKTTELAEAKNMLVATEYSFLHTSLDYAFKFNVLLNSTDSLLCERLLAFVYSQNMYYMQGTDSIKDVESTMKSTAVDLSAQNRELDRQKRVMEARHGEAQIKATQEANNLGCREQHVAAGVIKSGYLFVREKNTFRTWSRRFFSLRNGAMFAEVRSPKNDTGEEVFISDLRLATPKSTSSDVSDRQFCFELISPSVTHKLQASSDLQRDLWIAGIQDEIERALNKGKEGSAGASSDVSRAPSGNLLLQGDHHDAEHENMSLILDIPGNSTCAECGGRPTWCSINLGVTLCIECSGIHRSMGVHVSKVRSLTLDKLNPGIVQVMSSIGNDVSNEFFMCLLGPEQAALEQPNPKTERSVREAWIRNKYIDKAYVLPEDAAEMTKLLCEASAAGNMRECVRCLVGGADINALTPIDGENMHPLAAAVVNGHVTVVEYLILHQADVNAKCGSSNRSAIHYAAESGNVDLVHLLIKNKIDFTLQDGDGNDALKLAIAHAFADTATLLRLAQLDKDEGSKGPDDDYIGIKMDDFAKSVITKQTQ